MQPPRTKTGVQLIMDEIIHIAGRLGISTLAEDVETQKDEQFILSIGYDTGKGYLYCRPLNTEDFDNNYMKHTV